MDVDAPSNGAPPGTVPANGRVYESEDDDEPLIIKRHTPASPQLLRPAPVQSVPQAAPGAHAAPRAAVGGLPAGEGGLRER